MNALNRWTEVVDELRCLVAEVCGRQTKLTLAFSNSGQWTTCSGNFPLC